MTAEVIQFIPKPNPKRAEAERAVEITNRVSAEVWGRMEPNAFNASLGQQAPWRDADSNAYHGGYCAPEKDPA